MIAALILGLASPAAAQSAADFYKGKTFTIVDLLRKASAIK